MNRLLLLVWPIAIAALLVLLPSIGPLMDHHFAERQPYHGHFRTDEGHEHTYRVLHSHAAHQNADGNPALSDFGTTLAGFTVVALAESNAAEGLFTEPDSVLTLPGPAYSAIRPIYTSLLERPPQRRL